MTPSNAALRNLPSVDELLRTESGVAIAESAGSAHATRLARLTIDELRHEAASGKNGSRDLYLEDAVKRLNDRWLTEQQAELRGVLNATGVIVHTNLGRAPLPADARAAIQSEAAGYCTLEYDVSLGKRGKRAPMCETLLEELTGAEAALVVNNCAAAAFFVLTVFAAGGSVAISRGELVEIGGDFRVPDVLVQSGAMLCEVGTTNRTRLADYEKALDDGARIILRVHPSNYRIIGFTAMPSLTDLSALARKRGILLYEDIGSGALIDLSIYGLKDEPTVADSIRSGVDIVTFSGDKLLGGPQAGLIVGRRELVDRLRKHPLYRALRVDKLTYAALEATLKAYRRGSVTDIPVIAMLAESKESIRARAEKFIGQLDVSQSLQAELVDGVSAVGGGAAPLAELETVLIALTHPQINASDLEESLRKGDPPVIARIENDKVLLDLRTIAPSEEPPLLTRVRSLA
jgi:L-seryl-tRNA(Ser) seleniumtransferase